MFEIFIKSLFFIALVGCVYSYALYPLILMLMKKNSIKEDTNLSISGDELPKISLIITVHNEEHRINQKIENTLSLDYPADKLELIVASDASVDGTNDIVKAYDNRGVYLVNVAEHLGKENAQLAGIKASNGDIIVFSDVATEIEKNSLHCLVNAFRNLSVGAISSEDRFISQDGRVVGEGAYVKYEMWLRRQESQRAGLVGLSGSFFAARREVCDEWDIYSPSDFNTALNCAKKSLVAISSSKVVGIYSDVKDASLEYRRKLRTIIRGMTAIARHPEVLNPFKMGVFAFQVWSHKLLRWAVPWFMGLLLFVSFLLATKHEFYLLALLTQLIFYAIVLVGHFSIQLRDHPLVKIPYFFVQVNVAIAHATILFLMGQRMTTWTPSKR